ncbi:MAG: glucose-6-phosphate isomerase [Anaerovoracaceae bacterium]|jgi:glucose-6-phosphate isomerase
MNIKVELKNTGLDAAKVSARRKEAETALDRLWSGELDFTGWVRDPFDFSDHKIDELLEIAARIRSSSDYFLVLGVGGSFMGAKAVCDLLAEKNAGTRVIFAGYNFSGRYIREILDQIEGHEVSICVVSKSGSTTETLSAYGIFKQWMIDRYGREETARRTFVVTEHRSNYLFDEATAEGCTIFDLALDIGGRYSVLTPVGLLPIAVAGIDIRAMMDGARGVASKEAYRGQGLDYAISRQLFYEAGKRIEVFEFFDPYFAYFGEWLKQLFGESEGKDGKGLFPASLMFSRDLHSMGQFLQQGTDSFLETMITVSQATQDIDIPEIAMKPFAGKTIMQINECAEKGVLAAHVKAGIPVVSMSLPRLDAAMIGELMYFFETQCAISALLSGVDPFNQPGVEDYKREMRSYISKL